MKSRSPSIWRPILLLITSLTCFLSAGALQARHDYLTRGIPQSLPQPVNYGGAEIGVNIHLDQAHPDQLHDVVEAIAESGVRYVKQPFYFSERDAFDWQESDAVVSAIVDQDLEIAAHLDGDPASNYAPPSEPESFARWAAEFAQRYGAEIRYYFIWDEPNLTTHWGLQPANPAEYAALLAATSEAIRAVDQDAVIVAAPLAPTTEEGPQNLSDILYLRELYGAGAAPFFDVVAGKPYGFSSSPLDRRVDTGTLNFSRTILLREVMEQNNDGGKALFAGNWGWNALPDDWSGSPSIWGQVKADTRQQYVAEGLQRAKKEWPWMGLMFLEVWQAPVSEDDPRQGFNIAETPLETVLPDLARHGDLAMPGFHLASQNSVGQAFAGGWRFSPQFGADISQTGDSATFHFWGTDVGLRVRRADYRARLYVTIDGQPANALPHDGEGAALVLTAPDPAEDYVEIVPVARRLEPGPHVMTIEAYRGWDQWALNGFSVAYLPGGIPFRAAPGLLLVTGLLFAGLSVWSFRRVSLASYFQRLSGQVVRLNDAAGLALTLGAALLVTLTGWLTWGEQAAGVYRRLGDGSQLALTAAAASLFYVAPAFLIYIPALLVLFFLVYARPAWGLAIVALFFPFSVRPKPIGVYQFSPVEIFVLITAAAAILRGIGYLRGYLVRGSTHGKDAGALLSHLWQRGREQLNGADYAVVFLLVVATISLFFTERLDVATNEWRVVIVEPILFYFLMRAVGPSRGEMWSIVDAFVLGGVVVSIYGLWQYTFGEAITVEGGLRRLNAMYGSPNNVALYLGRIIPFLFALALMGGATPRRRRLYTVALVPVGLSLLLTFSKGGLFLGVPAGLGIVFLLWLRDQGRPMWPWFVAGVVALAFGALAISAVPALAQRLDLQGTTSFLRLSLWQASLNMFLENPLTGVGLDNFLYAYRGRYILESGWQEPYLNHPHNIVLDFATRLGLLGLLSGVWLFAVLLRQLWRLPASVNHAWRPIAIAIAGGVAQMVAHGLVDHSFFLVDLAFTFFLFLAIASWLRQSESVTN